MKMKGFHVNFFPIQIFIFRMLRNGVDAWRCSYFDLANYLQIIEKSLPATLTKTVKIICLLAKIETMYNSRMELVHFFHSSLQETKEDSSWTKTT